MAWSYLGSTVADGDVTLEPLPPPAGGLAGSDWEILALSLEGLHAPAIGERLGLPVAAVLRITGSADFRDQAARIEKALRAKITRAGDYEPLTAARAEAPKAMARMIQQSRVERDPRVRLAAHQAILKYAGVEPARKLEVTTPDRILEQMTPDELALFAAKRLWPARFRDTLRAFLPPAIADGSGLRPARLPTDTTVDITPEPATNGTPISTAPPADLPPASRPGADSPKTGS